MQKLKSRDHYILQGQHLQIDACMAENWVIVASNFYCARAAVECINKRDVLRGMLLTITMEASMAYHVVECTTHGMPGASGIPEHEYTLKLVDTALTVILMFTLILHKNFGSPKIVKFWLLSLFCLAMSEESVIGMILPDATYMKLAYALTHSLWHLALFHVAYLLAKA